MGFFDGAFGSIGGSLISTVGGFLGNRAAQGAANRQMDFQREMASTQHQREVADLRAAGLNPILSATGGSGAASPGGALAQVGNPLEGAGQGIQNAAQMAFRNPLQKAEVDLKEKEAQLADSAAKEKDWNSNKLKWEIENINEVNKILRWDQTLKYWQAKDAEQLFKQKHLKGSVSEDAHSVYDYGKQLLKDAATLEPSHVLKGAWETGKEYFNKAKDWLDKEFPAMKYKTPSDTFGHGKGNVHGGQHKAGQKKPWKDVEKERGVEDNVLHPNNWR